MGRLWRWKSGLVLVLMLHLLVHPAVHDQHVPELLSGSGSQHNLVREDASDAYDVCSLCRVANALHVPAPMLAAGQPLLQVGRKYVFVPRKPRTIERSQNTSRAPPAIA
jgi:hypothetical protein